MNKQLADIKARFPARPEGLDTLHEALDRFFTAADRAGASVRPGDRVALTTAAGEIAANIVAHACRELPDAEVLVALSRGPDRIEARFEDPGIPCEEPESERTGPVPHLGIGLNLARLCVDALEYARELDTNHWRLVRLTSEP